MLGEIEAGEHKETKSNTQACHQWRAWDASPPWGGSAKSQMLLWHQYLVLRKRRGGVSLVIGVFLVLASLSWVFQAFLFRGIAHGVSAFVVVDETCAAI